MTYSRENLLGGFNRMDIKIGQILRLKKQHPCGSYDWEVLRTGIDFRLKCTGCGHLIMIPRVKLEKNIKEIKESDSSFPPLK